MHVEFSKTLMASLDFKMDPTCVVSHIAFLSVVF